MKVSGPVAVHHYEYDDSNIPKRTATATGEEFKDEWSDYDRLLKGTSTVNGVFQENTYDTGGIWHGNGAAATEEPIGHITTASYQYDEWGGRFYDSWTGSVESSEGCVGGIQISDDIADSGMFSVGHRNCAAGVLGRFISRDPIGHSGNLNLYAYPTNPVNAVDPSGLDCTVHVVGKQPIHVQNYLQGIGSRLSAPKDWTIYAGSLGAHSEQGRSRLSVGGFSPAVTSVFNGKITTHIALPDHFGSLKPADQNLYLRFVLSLEADQARWFERLQKEQNCPGKEPTGVSLDELYDQEASAHINAIGEMAKRNIDPDRLDNVLGGGEGRLARIMLKYYKTQGVLGAMDVFHTGIPYENFLKNHGY